MRREEKRKRKKRMLIKLGIISFIVLAFVVSLFFADTLTDLINSGFNRDYSLHQVSYEQVSDSSFYVSYLDVGQGNCAFAKLPGGETLLIDGGDTKYGSAVCDFLKQHNVACIDYMIATHADADHIGGLNAVLDEYEVKNIYRPFQISGSNSSYKDFVVFENEKLELAYRYYNPEKYSAGSSTSTLSDKSRISRVTSEVYKKFITAIYSEKYTEGSESLEADVTVFYDGLKIEGDGYSIEFFAPLVRDEKYDLYPTTGTHGYATIGYGGDESNQNSSMFLLNCEGKKFFFSGDAEFTDGSSKKTGKPEGGVSKSGFAEVDFLSSLTASDRAKLKDVDVFILGHHGSKFSSGEELLDVLSPEFIIISVGKNTYGHPTQEALDRAAAVDGLASDYLLRTDECGDITFGSLNNSLCYCRLRGNSGENLQQKRISWYLVGGVATAILCVIVIFAGVTPKKVHWGNY